MNLNRGIESGLKGLSLFACILWGTVAVGAAEVELEDFPFGDRLLLGTVPVKVEARRTFTYHAPFSGLVEQLVPHSSDEAANGELLLFLDRERMEIESRLLAIERELSEKQQIPEQQLALFQSLRQIENREVEIGQQLAFIQEIERNPELSRLFSRESESTPLDEAAALDRLELERRVIQRILASLEQPEVRELAEELVTLQLRKRELEHEKSLREARITMPFDGSYRLLLPVSPDAGEAPVRVQQGDALIEVEDLSALYGLVEIHGVRWRTLPREQLELGIPGMGGFSSDDRAVFDQAMTLTQSRAGEALVYRFEFRGEGREAAARIRGGSVTGEVHLRLYPERTRIVPKLALLAAYPEAFGQSWEAGVRAVFDGVETVYVGRDALAIVIGAPE